ncbi:MAG: hypothetical protein KK926_03900 [Methanomethylovorans sp.]|nr:hypothetical protein [Methanomethylovorans sp.]
MIGKYVYHLPFHRSIAMFKLAGVFIPASTVNGWFGGSSDLPTSKSSQLFIVHQFFRVDLKFLNFFIIVRFKILNNHFASLPN